MLKSQETNDESTPTRSVAQARVTPDELSAALAAIEARRQAEASRLAGTIPIEEAVSSLHLDSTPDEIWAEVQAQRAKAETVQNQSFAAADAARREHLRQTQASQSTVVRTPLGLPKHRPNRRWMGLLTPILLIWVFAQTGPQIWHRIAPAITHASTPHVAKLSTLDKIPDGQEVYIDNQSLVQISQGASSSKMTVDENPSDTEWRIVKIAGHIYLRGYILETDSLTSLQGKPLNVYSDDDSGELEGEKTSQITLRVDKIPLQKSGDGDYSEVTFSNFQSDTFTTLDEWK